MRDRTMRKLLTLSLLTVLLVGGCASGDYKAFVDPSDEIIESNYRSSSDYNLCWLTFQLGAVLRSKEFRYRRYIRLLKEIDSRNLDCKSFPELTDEEAWMEDWIKEYEESLEQ